jgi:uncharacterized membrane protein YfhO
VVESNGAAAQDQAQSATIVEYHNSKVVISTQADKASVLIITDNWHPNWRAQLDGSPVYIGLVDETFRGVAVPPGSHKIVMTYRPQSLTLGIALSGLTLLALTIILIAQRRIDALLARI